MLLQTELQQKRPRFAKKNPFQLRQRTKLCLGYCSIKTIGIMVPDHSTSPLFSRLGSIKPLFVRRHEEMSEKKILLKRRSDCRKELLFYKLGQILLIERDQQIRTALDDLCKPKRRLR